MLLDPSLPQDKYVVGVARGALSQLHRLCLFVDRAGPPILVCALVPFKDRSTLWEAALENKVQLVQNAVD